MLQQAADSLLRWSPSAIHDTVSVIVAQSVFQRRLGRSLAQRFWAWFWDQIAALFNTVAGTPAARTITLFVVGLILAALVVRLVYAARYERRAPRVTSSLSGRMSHRVPTIEEARRLAHEGRYADAMHVLYGALLDALAQRRLIRLHASKTSGDFARELHQRGHPAVGPFRAFVRRFDRLFYGYDVCDSAAFDALWVDAERVLHSAHSPESAAAARI